MIFLNINELITVFGKASIVLPIVQIILGVIPSLLKDFFATKKEFGNRVSFLTEKLTEKTSVLLYQIFERKDNTEINLRGSPPESPDLLNPYHKQVQSSLETNMILNRIHKDYKSCYMLLFIIIILGIIASVLVYMELLVTITFLISFGLIIAEIVIIIFMFRMTNRLEYFELQN